MKQLETRIVCFMMYRCLRKPIEQFLYSGDGYEITPVYNPQLYDSSVVDISFINFVKYISTAYGSIYEYEAQCLIDEFRMQSERKEALRFRSKHPLYVCSTPEEQNRCLLSGLIHQGIAIPHYFDGNKLLI